MSFRGWWHSSVLSFFFAISVPALKSALTMRILVRLADAALGAKSYTGVVHVFLGRWGDNVAFAATMLFVPLLSASCISLAVDVVPQVFDSVSPALAACLAVGVAAPFACTTSLKHLSKAALLGLVAILYSCAVVAVECLAWGQHGPRAFVFERQSLLIVVASQGLSAFAGEIAMLEMCYLGVSKEKRRHFVRWVVDASLVTLMVVYMSLATVAFALFGDDCKDYVLLNLHGSALVSAAQAAVVLSNALRAPLLCVVIYVVVAAKFPDTLARVEGVSDWARPALQLACLLLSGAVAFCLRPADLGIAIAIAGGTCGVLINVVVPSLAWLQARRDGRVQRSRALDSAACLMLVAIPILSVAFLVAVGQEQARAN